MSVNAGVITINRRFQYESYWPYIRGFKEVVQQAWAADAGVACSLTRLNTKLWRTSKALRAWSKTYIGDIKKQPFIINELILQLDLTQDFRPLSGDEREMRAKLKARTLRLVVLLKIKKLQRSHILWLKAGDANSNFSTSRLMADTSRMPYMSCTAPMVRFLPPRPCPRSRARAHTHTLSISLAQSSTPHYGD